MSGPPDETPNSNGVPGPSPDGSGVLANLPRTRPQRSTARRTEARERRIAEEAAPREAKPRRPRKLEAVATPAPAAKPSGGERRAKPRPDRPESRVRKPPARPAAEETVPLQGFECIEERATGPVQPPGGTELIASAAEALSEIAKAGISTGERLLRDMFSLLPRS